MQKSALVIFLTVFLATSLLLGGCSNKQPPVKVVKSIPWHLQDQDGDGVRNGEDRCDCTPDGATVNGEGCWVLSMKVLFAFDSYELSESGKVALQEVIRILLKNPGLRITIIGHADKFGASKYNLSLSQKRADAVRRHLMNKGISGWHLVTIGIGEMWADQSVKSKQGGAKDRKIEFSPEC